MIRYDQIDKKINRGKTLIFNKGREKTIYKIFSLLLAALLGITLWAGAMPNNGIKTYRHNSGLTLQHPVNWTVTEKEAGVSILPGDAKKNAMGQPLEVLLLLSVPAQGITSVNSPQVLQFFDMTMNEMFGNMQRQGQTKQITIKQ
ncbi:MAG: hypothetical protein PVH61_04480 [Candidatus Aminicenantes bacterium]|jgi:hypothetical protein